MCSPLTSFGRYLSFLRVAAVAIDLVDAKVGVRAVTEPHRSRRAADFLHRDDVREVSHRRCRRSVSGTVIPSRPISPSFGQRSFGNSLLRSISAASGAISACAKVADRVAQQVGCPRRDQNSMTVYGSWLAPVSGACACFALAVAVSCGRLPLRNWSAMDFVEIFATRCRDPRRCALQRLATLARTFPACDSSCATSPRSGVIQRRRIRESRPTTSQAACRAVSVAGARDRVRGRCAGCPRAAGSSRLFFLVHALRVRDVIRRTRPPARRCCRLRALLADCAIDRLSQLFRSRGYTAISVPVMLATSQSSSPSSAMQISPSATNTLRPALAHLARWRGKRSPGGRRQQVDLELDGEHARVRRHQAENAA